MNSKVKKGQMGINSGNTRIVEENIHPEVFSVFYCWNYFLTNVDISTDELIHGWLDGKLDGLS